MSLKDNMKKKAEELDLEGMARQLQEAAAKAARSAREKAGDFATQNRDKIGEYVEQAGAKFDEKTHAKYADTVAKVKEQVGRGVDKIAEGGQAAAPAPGAAGATSGMAAERPSPPDPESPAASVAPEPGDESGFNAAAGDVPVPAQEALHDTTLEDPSLGADNPESPTLSDPPAPEDARSYVDRDGLL